MAVTALKSPDAAARWLRSWVTGTLTTDSRKVKPGDAFIAWPGQANDGRRFVQSALGAGATTCIVEREGLEAFGFDDARIASLPGLKAAAGVVADAFFDRPSATMDVLAVTGTNGKSSSAWWAAQALTLLGRRAGVIGTLGIGEPPGPGGGARIEFTGLTTPDPVMLHAALRRFANQGFAACTIEASSIGIEEQRLAGLRVAVAIFTNFTQDHLDYHGTMQAYWAAKRKLFAWPGLRAAVVNIDDAHGESLARELAAPGTLSVWTVSARQSASLSARGIGYVDGGLAFTLHEGEDQVPVRSALIGDYNAGNLLGVIGALRALGIPLGEAAAAVPRLTPVPGRMQRVGDGLGAPQVVVDYAHTPDALEKVLIALRPLAATRGGRLVCVFGCGGNRDATKRPLMGAIAERCADRVVVTSDNPRGESPQAILAQIVAGIGRRTAAEVIEDRRAAVAQAVAEAAAQDVIVLAGKGHEDYQEIAGVRHPFSDVAEATQALMQRGAGTRHATPSGPSPSRRAR
ncbi:MAG: UDP-N-acetylmuramoyl-L-alanyl-D-glutamate--2,6-diaminopimelate ligase [Aquincola sp.]|nr:UDP-N-acetylmuramoyl-L-alanyl-D-glutamate--2,6-diaminopimelate ligase [Aquincola sp.]MDH5329893.1 UDP-N-acetylmuramoyl-L-alanyl-D-glutamate--2,6-diaminopimelate ligase [Aquincola sp.]